MKVRIIRNKVQREAMAFRIWQYADPRGWDVTLREIADALDVGGHTVGRIIKRKGWMTRIRARRSFGADHHHGWIETRTVLADIEELKL